MTQPDKNFPAATSGLSDSIRAPIVRTSDGKLAAPQNIIRTITAAKAIYYKWRAQNLKRIQLEAAIEGLIAGNPPYNPQDLRKKGLSHIANFNTLDARSLYKRGALAYWNLLNQASTLFKFTLNLGDPQQVLWAEALSRNLDYVVRSWPSFSINTNILSAQLVKFGLSPVLWPDEKDWRWRVIDTSKFYISDQSYSDIDQLTGIAVESTFTAQHLFQVYERMSELPEAERPWDLDELSNLLLFIANTNAKTQSQPWIDFMDLQRRLQNGDIGFDVVFNDNIPLVSLLYTEYSGKISHYMFHPTYDRGKILFFINEQYNHICEALNIFTMSPGEFMIHSNRGLGHEIFSITQAMNQLDCSMVDMAKFTSTPFLKSMSTGSKDFEAIQVKPGVPTNIGTAEFVQTNFGANIEQLIGGSNFLLQKVQLNTANAGDDPGIPDRSLGSISPSQARMMAFKEFGVLKNNIAHFYSQFDYVAKNMAGKLWNSHDGDPGYAFAKKWKQRCRQDGVPEEILKTPGDKDNYGLPAFMDICATRVAGGGSDLALIMGLQELMPIAGDFGPKAALVYNKLWVSATIGKDYVPAFTEEKENPDAVSGGASIAQLENAVMRQGESPLFSLDNEHRAHMAVHMALATNTIQQIQQQQFSPIEADKIFVILVPHLKEHFDALTRSPFTQGFVAQIKKPFEQVVQYATLNAKNAGAQMQAEIKRRQAQEAQQQRVLTDEELKNITTQNDERRKDTKLGAQLQRQAQMTETKADIARTAVEKDAENKRLKVTLDSEVKKMETLNNSNKTLETKTLPELRVDIARRGGVTPSPFDIES